MVCNTKFETLYGPPWGLARSYLDVLGVSCEVEAGRRDRHSRSEDVTRCLRVMNFSPSCAPNQQLHDRTMFRWCRSGRGRNPAARATFRHVLELKPSSSPASPPSGRPSCSDRWLRPPAPPLGNSSAQRRQLPQSYQRTAAGNRRAGAASRLLGTPASVNPRFAADGRVGPVWTSSLGYSHIPSRAGEQTTVPGTARRFRQEIRHAAALRGQRLGVEIASSPAKDAKSAAEKEYSSARLSLLFSNGLRAGRLLSS
jgi:hypothetical protein